MKTKNKIIQIKAKGFIRRSQTRRLFGEGGQSAIEMAAAIIAVFIFFLGTLQIFVWFNSLLVQRQQYYESSRVDAASTEAGAYDWTPPGLDIFNSQGE